MNDEDENNDLKLAIIREKCEEDHLFFTRYFFKTRNGFKFKLNWHHYVLASVVDRIMNGELKNILINIAPGSSKTEEVVVNLIARGIAKNPHSKFLHLTYSDTLANVNSQGARDIVTSDEFQELWPTKISNDDKAKSRWNVLVNEKKAGGCYAVATGGQVTGFRAGRMVEGFQGAIIIDDPLKPEDGFSKANTKAANRKLVSTIKSRKANPDTPMIVIMQRLSESDPSAFIKSGNLDEQGEWKHLSIPALITDKWIEENKEWLTPEIESMIDKSEVDDDGRFSYWPYKEPLQTLLKMESGTFVDEEGARLSRLVFAGQYMQSPTALGGNIFKGEHFFKYRQLPKMKKRIMVADTASKTAEHNDYSVFELWGHGVDGRIYLIDMIRGKWKSPELKTRATAFWKKHATPEKNEEHGTLSKLYVEDKSSGTDLIQTLSVDYNLKIPVAAIQRNKDKFTRANDALPYIESNFVGVPEDAPFTNDFITECEAFTADNTHKHDDQIDPMLDAVEILLSNKNKMKQWENLI